MKTHASVLIVDDEPNALKVLSSILKAEGYVVHESLGVEEAISVVHERPVDAVITDIKMPRQDGYCLFDYIAEHAPHIPVIYLTAYGTVDSAVQAVSNGAFYYFIKPPDYQKLKKVLAKAVSRHNLLPAAVSGTVEHPVGPAFLISRSPAMAAVSRTIARVRKSESSVLICGETGTGKEIVAKHLHAGGARNGKPFVAVNCAAIPRELLEAELFGYEKGAFTGAADCRIGRIEEASGGTLFLDEIGEMEPSLQAKLLRVLQERAISRLGSNKTIKVDFRLLSSTNRNLRREMESGTFRPDLFYRINVVCVELPPLRDRREDLPLLIDEFLKEFCIRESKRLSVSGDVMALLQDYSWPGNVRQLRNVIEHAVVICNGATITAGDLPEELRARKDASSRTIKPLRSVELQAIKHALAECAGNISQAARRLGISRKAVYARLRKA